MSKRNRLRSYFLVEKQVNYCRNSAGFLDIVESSKKSQRTNLPRMKGLTMKGDEKEDDY